MLAHVGITYLNNHRVGRKARICVAQGLLAYEE